MRVKKRHGFYPYVSFAFDGLSIYLGTLDDFKSAGTGQQLQAFNDQYVLNSAHL